MLSQESRRKLAATIRHLREQLRTDLREEAERAYRMSVDIGAARLTEAPRARRERLDAWLDERVRASGAKPGRASAEVRSRVLDEAVERVAATFLNRLVALRMLEESGAVRPAVLTGGLDSKAARELRQHAPALFADENEGYAWLLAQVFEDLAVDLPGLFGDVGLVDLFPVPHATLRAAVEALDDAELAGAWEDDTTLGWVYQFWNDPAREAIDDRLSRKGRVAQHELACKTQLFTERYMAEWLLANTLGRLWLAICQRNGWRPTASDELDALASWRSAEPTPGRELPPAGTFWRYFVPRALTPAEVDGAPLSLRDVRVLDPACGSGHFLVLALGILLALYREEARLRGETWSDADIVGWALGKNMHGVDIDPRAVQIAAAGLYLRARKFSRTAPVPPLALVATAFDLSGLGAEDVALRALQDALQRDAAIPAEVTVRCVGALSGAAHLGSLLRPDSAIREALRPLVAPAPQGELFAPRRSAAASEEELRAILVARVEEFLGRHTASNDLGLRSDGEQLAAGVRLTRILRDGTFDVVVGNPPYLSSSKMVDSAHLKKHYPDGQADLFGAFFIRGDELLRPGGYLGLVTLSNWLFLSSFRDLRARLLQRELVALADLGKGAFSQASALINTAMAVLRKAAATSDAVAIRVPAGDGGAIERADAALVAATPRFVFDPTTLAAIDGSPVLFWLDPGFLARYASLSKVRERATLRAGIATYDNERFLRTPWEVEVDAWKPGPGRRYVPYIKGAKGRAWFDSLTALLRWRAHGLELRVASEQRSGGVLRLREPRELGIAYTTIGNAFSARLHRVPGLLDVSGASIFPPPEERAAMVCALNRTETRRFIEALNPTVNFQLSDVARAPVVAVPEAERVVETIGAAFDTAEEARETSVNFKAPGPTAWGYAQRWAQAAVDRGPSEPLPVWAPEAEAPTPVAELSFALGVALGRFGARAQGWLAQAPDAALPDGILFLSSAAERDGLAAEATALLRETWDRVGAVVAPGESLRTWLQKRLFEHHREAYENRPIFLPLSSERRNFVAWVAIHRWRRDTLQVLLAEHLLPERRSLEGRIEDLRQARGGATSRRNAAERQLAEVQRHLDELVRFIENVQACADRGPPPTDARCPAREGDAPFTMDLDDGVAMNASALWPLLDPQWNDPRRWWKEVCLAEGRRDYDWSPVVARYFPRRVEAKCVSDRGLAVAHRRLWRLHPETAYAWELRLRDELSSDFVLDEPDADTLRQRFLTERADDARRLRDEHARRSARGRDEAEESPLLTDATPDELAEEA